MRFDVRSLSLLFVLLGGCVDALPDPTIRVDVARVLAIRSEPAEAAPNQSVTWTALYADASGTLTVAPLDWTYCTARKPLDELGPVATECFDRSAMTHIAIGSGVSVEAKLPRDACRLFGPNPPASQPGEPSGRPVDPDATGGFYQPTIAFRTDGLGESATLAQVRIACALSNAPTEAVIAYNQRYRRNANPAIESMELTLDGTTTVLLEDESLPSVSVPASSHVTLTVRWPNCPVDGICGDAICGDDESLESCAPDCTVPATCAGAETYVVYDPARTELVRRREAMSVTWYSNAGELETARTGVSGDDSSSATTNRLSLDANARDTLVWAVLRDERGGVDFRAYRITSTE